MIHFQCDYAEGAHPLILDRLVQTNLEQTPGYGRDHYCTQARDRIRQLCHLPSAMVEFLVGGTQSNTTVISSLLSPFQGVLCADTGHIEAHEAGAIESTGHKVLPLVTSDGLLTPQQIAQFCECHWCDPNRDHTVQPGMVYLSQPTETGLLYSLTQLEEIHRVCQTYQLLLFVDGARLGYGLASPKNDVTIHHLARLCDAFSIGGTKLGALFGEAVVLPNPQLQPHFRYMIKRHGGMFAKGRLLGLQFDTMFQDDLYWKLGKQGVQMALSIRETLLHCGVPLLYDSYTNQQFPIFSLHQWETLSQSYLFTQWTPLAHQQVTARICTSWATSEEAVNQLNLDLQRVCRP